MKSGVTTPEELLRVVTEVREMRTLCPGCGAAVGVDFMACPHCGNASERRLPALRPALQPGWKFCPYCAHEHGVAKRVEAPAARRSAATLRELPPGNVAEFKK